MMQEHDLQELAELVSNEAPFTSLYLSVDAHRRSSDEYKLALRQMLNQAAEWGAAAADVERIERYFGHEYGRQGRGVACFSCSAIDYWRAHVLLAPVDDMVFVGMRPYVKPLSDLWDTFDRFGVVMVDREGARAFIYHLGALEDSGGTLGQEVKRHKQGGWAAQKFQRSEDQDARYNLKEAAQWADAFLRRLDVKRVVLSGSDGNLAQFREELPRPLLDKVVGQISLDMNASPGQVWERAFEVAAAAQQKAETELLEQVVTLAHKGGAGALGLADTLNALQQGRVHQVLVERNFHSPGLQCNDCHAVVIEPVNSCPYCSGEMRRSADVVNLAVQHAIGTGLKVSVLAPHPKLAEIGHIAAVLRY